MAKVIFVLTSKRVIIASVAVAGMLAACQSRRPLEFVEFGQSTPEITLTPIAAVLADPARFSGRRIRLQGVLHIEFESNQVCLDRPSLEFFATGNCLRLSLASQLADEEGQIARWNGSYATLEGVLETTTTRDHFPARLAEVSSVLVITSKRRL